jgi:hypothetical protein
LRKTVNPGGAVVARAAGGNKAQDQAQFIGRALCLRAVFSGQPHVMSDLTRP